MTTNAHRIWAATALLITATILATVYGGSWETMGAALGAILLLLLSAAPEGNRR